MKWSEIKTLKELRACTYADAKQIRDTAKAANRDLTADETAKHSELVSKLEDVNLKLMEAEAGDGDNMRSMIGRDNAATIGDGDKRRVPGHP